MILTGHLLIGGAIGVVASTQIPSPWSVPVALGLGVLSHHLLDLIPHTDAATFWPDQGNIPGVALVVVTLEVLAGLTLTGTLLITQHTSWAFVAGALSGILPDVLDEMPLWQHLFRANALGGVWHHWHCRLHCSNMAARWHLGLIIDAVVIAGGLWFLLTA
jgi:hypothetical protein